MLCPGGAPSETLIFGDLPASLLMEPRQGESPSGYCQRMRQPGQWGSVAELLALTRVLQRPIRVHAAHGVETYGAEQTGAALAVHFEGSHYRAVTEELTAEAQAELDHARTREYWRDEL